MARKINTVLNVFLVLSAIVLVGMLSVIGDDNETFFLLVFGEWFSGISLIMLQETLFPLLHYTIGLIIITVNYVSGSIPLIRARLSDPSLMVYARIAIPIIVILAIYTCIIIGYKNKDDRFMCVAKLLHLLYVTFIVLLLYFV